MYFVYKPHFMSERGNWFKVELEPVKKLRAQTAEDAIAEARRLGFSVPIVGKAEEEQLQ